MQISEAPASSGGGRGSEIPSRRRSARVLPRLLQVWCGGLSVEGGVDDCGDFRGMGAGGAQAGVSGHRGAAQAARGEGGRVRLDRAVSESERAGEVLVAVVLAGRARAAGVEGRRSASGG